MRPHRCQEDPSHQLRHRHGAFAKPVERRVRCVELEAYANVQTVNRASSSVVSSSIVWAIGPLPPTSPQIEAPEVPTGFAIEFNGADFEQVIGKGGTVHHPLTDKIDAGFLEGLREGTAGEAITSDASPMRVEGPLPRPGATPSPPSCPRSRRWFSSSTDKLGLDALTAVSLHGVRQPQVRRRRVRRGLQRTFTGKTLAASQECPPRRLPSTSRSWRPRWRSKLLGEGGYAMQVQADRIDVTAPAIARQRMCAMQTIPAKMTKTRRPTEHPAGEIPRDYPRFPVRGFMTGYRAPAHLALEVVGSCAARTMRYHEMNDLQLPLG
ncbi:MAG: hypothetical protein ACLTSX_02995 [Collinsella sp.]